MRAAAEERVRREWGFELPESLFRFSDFLASLGRAERSALQMDVGISPCGIMDLLDDPDAQPRDGIDVRVHGRYYRDPPEFLTFMHGGSDGLHFGLWLDDGRSCAGVGSYYNNDGGGIGVPSGTPLEAARMLLERVWRDLVDYGEAEGDRGRGVRRLREALLAFETGDRPEEGLSYVNRYDVGPAADAGRIMTYDGAGAMVTGETTANRPPAGHPNEWMFAKHLRGQLAGGADDVAAHVAEARRRCQDGDPAEALVLGRDLHWLSGGDPVRERYAHELLVMAYRALGRDSLAEIADAHHRHRDLPQVTVLR